jgi:hypothetical protein
MMPMPPTGIPDTGAQVVHPSIMTQADMYGFDQGYLMLPPPDMMYLPSLHDMYAQDISRGSTPMMPVEDTCMFYPPHMNRTATPSNHEMMEMMQHQQHHQMHMHQPQQQFYYYPPPVASPQLSVHTNTESLPMHHSPGSRGHTPMAQHWDHNSSTSNSTNNYEIIQLIMVQMYVYSNDSFYIV